MKRISCETVKAIQRYKVRCKALKATCKEKIAEEKRRAHHAVASCLKRKMRASDSCLERVKRLEKQKACSGVKPALTGGVIGFVAGIVVATVTLFLWGK